MTARKIFAVWQRSNVFREYERPDVETLIEWIKEFEEEMK